MARPALMGIDLGTTAVKVGLFDPDRGEALAVTRSEYTPASPHPGWVELTARTYWDGTVAATREALAQAGDAQVIGVGLSSQGQTFVPLGEGHEPLRPAIVWLDTRAEAQAQWLRENLDLDEFRRRTGAGEPNAVASASKMLWIREHEPEVWARTRYLVMLPDWIGLLLTGQRRLDVHNAGSTHLVDRAAEDWWDAGLAAVGIPREWMSPLGWAGEVIGEVTGEAAGELGIAAGVPVALGSNDQLCGAVGVGNVTPGIASGTVGTATAIITTHEMPADGDAPAHPVRGLAYQLFYAKCAGMLLTWLRDMLAPGESYEALLAEAAEVPPGADGLTCLPHFSGTATPNFRSDVRGGFVGLTLGHGRAHLVRAVTEAVCFAARDALTLAEQVASRPDELRMLGGATQSDPWMQMVADTVRLPLHVPVCGEAPALGAAIFAGLASGRFDSMTAGADRFYRSDRTFEPREDQAALYDDAYAAYCDAMERVYPGALGLDQDSLRRYGL